MDEVDIALPLAIAFDDTDSRVDQIPASVNGQNLIGRHRKVMIGIVSRSEGNSCFTEAYHSGAETGSKS